MQLRDPQVPIVASAAGRILTTAGEVRDQLAHQLDMRVEWTRSVSAMIAGGVDTFVEVGPGQVLSGLIRRVSEDVRALSLANLAEALAPARPTEPDVV